MIYDVVTHEGESGKERLRRLLIGPNVEGAKATDIDYWSESKMGVIVCDEVAGVTN